MSAGFSPTQEAEVHSQQLSAVLTEQPSKSALPSIAVSRHSDVYQSKKLSDRGILQQNLKRRSGTGTAGTDLLRTEVSWRCRNSRKGMTNEKQQTTACGFLRALIAYKERYDWSWNGWRCNFPCEAEKAKAGTGLADKPSALCMAVTIIDALIDTHTLSKIETRGSTHGVR